MITILDIKKVEITKTLETKDLVKTITNNTINTWQIDRSFQKKQQDTNLGKIAENIFETYCKKHLNNIKYISYDTFRSNNYSKHAPFDGLIYNDKKTTNNVIESYFKNINEQVTNNQYGKITDELKQELYDNDIYIVEIKSTRVVNRHMNNQKVELENILNDDFLEYPKYLRTDTYDSINSWKDYFEFCKKNKNFNGDIQNLQNEEKINMRHIYIRIYIYEQNNEAYIIGWTSNTDFIKNAVVKKMIQYNKSEKALYLSTKLRNGYNIDELNIIFTDYDQY